MRVEYFTDQVWTHDKVCGGRQPLSCVARTFKSADVRGRPVERMVPCLLVRSRKEREPIFSDPGLSGPSSHDLQFVPRRLG